MKALHARTVTEDFMLRRVTARPSQVTGEASQEASRPRSSNFLRAVWIEAASVTIYTR